MDISKAGVGHGGANKDEVPSSYGGAVRVRRHDDLRNQYDDLRERNRLLRHQCQVWWCLNLYCSLIVSWPYMTAAEFYTKLKKDIFLT